MNEKLETCKSSILSSKENLHFFLVAYPCYVSFMASCVEISLFLNNSMTSLFSKLRGWGIEFYRFIGSFFALKKSQKPSCWKVSRTEIESFTFFFRNHNSKRFTMPHIFLYHTSKPIQTPHGIQTYSPPRSSHQSVSRIYSV